MNLNKCLYVSQIWSVKQYVFLRTLKTNKNSKNSSQLLKSQVSLMNKVICLKKVLYSFDNIYIFLMNITKVYKNDFHE